MPPKNNDSKEKNKNEKKSNKKVEAELSEEDEKKKQELEELVEKIKNGEIAAQRESIEELIKELRQTTTSVTSIPKPLKFLGPHYESLKKFYEENIPSNSDLKKKVADILSVLAMTMSKEGSRESLKFKLNGSLEELDQWGHEYLRYLSGEIGLEYQARLNDQYEKEDKQQTNEIVEEAEFSDLMHVVDLIIPIMMKSQSESDAIDLLLDVEQLEKIVPYCDKNNYNRVCLYLLSCSKYLLYPDNMNTLKIVHKIYGNLQKFSESIRIAIMMNDINLVKQTFDSCKDDLLLQKQMSFILSQHNINLKKQQEDDDDLNNDEEDVEEDEDDEEEDILGEIMGKNKNSEHFLYLAKELDAVEPKTPESIFKSHLSESRSTMEQQIDSAKQNLASSFVNAFVNAAYGTDKLMTEDGTKWLYKNKEHGMMSTAASLGLLYKWNTEEGFSEIDKYLYSNDNYIKGGTLLAIGICNSGIQGDLDSAFALLSEHVESKNRDLRIGSILGLGIGYAGTNHEEINEILLPILADADQPIDIVSFAALSLGLIFIGTCNEDISSTIIDVLMERNEKVLKGPLVSYLCLSLGLLFMGKEEQADAIIETIESTLSPTISKFCSYIVQVCSSMGSGNVLKVQQLLKSCYETSDETTQSKDSSKEESGEKKTDKSSSPSTTGDANSKTTASSSTTTEESEKKKEEEEEEDLRHQSVAVIGIAMIALGEELGMEMVIRTMDHLLQYGGVTVKRSIPLALALLNISNPAMNVMDTLSKMTHDTDTDVSQNAILSLGLIGAGTNNARIAQMLRQLSVYYSKDSDHLFLVKISQGLLFLGKGLLTLSPIYSDKGLINNVSVGSLLVVLFSMFNMKSTILDQYHYLLYFLSSAMNTRMLVTVDKDLNPIEVSVRVGQAVDTVTQAGKPRSITGFQTHNTPVILQTGERAELATEKYIPLTSTLEGVVILKENPDFVEE